MSLYGQCPIPQFPQCGSPQGFRNTQKYVALVTVFVIASKVKGKVINQHVVQHEVVLCAVVVSVSMPEKQLRIILIESLISTLVSVSVTILTLLAVLLIE